MKPGAAWREEPWWHWDWPGRPGSYLVQGNGVQNLGTNEAPRSATAANLWVPDPEARRGWREYYVYHDPPPPPPGRKLGL